jgi:hypothetical protein
MWLPYVWEGKAAQFSIAIAIRWLTERQSQTVQSKSACFFSHNFSTMSLRAGSVKSLRGEANSSRSSACYEFASSFLLAMTNS